MSVSLGRQTAEGREKKAVGKMSLIVPITERHDDIVEMVLEYRDALAGAGMPYEMIVVVDGGFEKAHGQLKELKRRVDNLTIIKQARAYGESTAITAGFRHSSGDAILLAPPYHQVDFKEFPKLFEGLEGADMVVVRRWPRIDSRLNRIQTSVFHRIVSALAGNVATDIGCGVRMVRREVLEEISLYGDLHRFLPILAHRQGFKVREVDMKQSTGERRVRTYPMGTYLRRLIDLLTVFFLVKFTRKPLRFFGLTGSAVLLAGLGVTAYLVAGRLFFGVGLSDRPLFLIGVLFVVLGLQIFAIGLVGEIIIFTHAKDIKEYQIEEIINSHPEEDLPE